MFLNLQNIIAIDSTTLFYGLLRIVSISIALNFFVRCFQRDPRLIEFAETLPGPRTIPLLGSYAEFYYGEDSLKTLTNFLKKYGHIYKLWIGKYLVVGLSNVEDLEAVFMSSKMLAKPRMFQPYRDVWGDGIFTAPVDIWRQNRKKIYPVFGNNAFDTYVAEINEITHDAINDLKTNFIDEKEFSVWDFFVYVSFNLSTKTILKMKTDSWDRELITKFHQNLSKTQEISFDRMCLPWFHIKFIDILYHYRQVKNINDANREWARKVINDIKYETTQTLCDNRGNESTDSTKSFREIVRQMLEEKYDEKIICDEIYTMITGGTNSNASANSFFLIAIAIHQDIQNKLYDEIYSVFGDSDRDADQEDVKRLTYLDQVLKESLRRFTVAPFILREVQEDSKIGDRLFPAGTVILVPIGAVHFNPEYYPNPMDFDPEHFSSDAIKKRHKLTYFLPFSASSRNCIAQNFAMLEFKLLLSCLLRNFSFHTTMTMNDIEFNMGSVTHSNTLKLSIKPRIRKQS